MLISTENCRTLIEIKAEINHIKGKRDYLQSAQSYVTPIRISICMNEFLKYLKFFIFP